MLERWSMAMIRGRFLVIGIWLLAGVLGLLAASGLAGLLTSPLTVPNTQSSAVNQILLRHFGQNVEGTFTIVLPVGNASAREIARDVVLVDAAVRQMRTSQITEQKSLFGLLYTNVNTSFALSRAAAQTPLLRRYLADEGLVGALVTGPPALQHDLTPVLASDLRWGELLAVALALVLLIAVLGLCWAVAIPIAVAAVTIAADVGLVFLLAHVVSMVLYIPNVIELLALGLAIDFSLLIVHRFRSELADERVSVELAVTATMKTAGRTVVTSSVIVAIGLAILTAIPVPFLRSLGVAGFVVPIVAMAAALTLQPALLAVVGRRGTRAVGNSGLVRGDSSKGFWARLARGVVARPIITLASALVFLALCCVPVLALQLTPGSTSAIPQNLPSARALTLLSGRVGPGVIAPNQIVIDLRHAHLATTASVREATQALATRLNQDPEVVGWAIGTRPPYVDVTGRYEQILVIGRDQIGAEASQQLVTRLRDVYVPQAHLGAGVRIYVGGAPAQGVDFLDSVYGAFPWVVALALVLALIVLARTFRSLVLAVVSIALNLLSVCAALGLVVLMTRFGVGSDLFGSFQVSQIEGWVPVFLFAVLFGLSMDYEVFLVSRMRESYDAGMSTRAAIVNGVARTGGVISAAAVILAGAMCGLVFGHVAGLQELGVGLALGVLVDATVVRGLVLPSVMTLLGRWNWWMPDRAARVLRVTASPLESRGARP